MKKIKLTEEVERKKIELLIYASYCMGFISCSENKTIDNPDCLKEIRALIELIIENK